MEAQNARQDVGEQLAGGNGAVAADGVETDPEGPGWQQARVVPGRQGHEFGFRVGGPQFVLDGADTRCRVVGEEPGTQIEEGDVERALHILEGGDQVPWLQIVAPQAEDAGTYPREVGDGRNALVADQAAVLAGLEQGLHHQVRQGRLVGAFEHGHGLFPRQRRDQFLLREGLQQFDGDHAHRFPLGAQIGGHGLRVVGHGAETDDDVLGVFEPIAHHGRVDAPGQDPVFGHRLGDEFRHFALEMGVMVHRSGLEVRLVLDPAGQPGGMHVHQ